MARERYLLHTGDEEIHDQEKEIKLVTKKDKWSNFWYYHKRHVIIGIFLVALLGMFIYDMVSKINPDYTISLVVGDGYMTEQDTLELEEELARYGEDLNGDGQTVVSVVTYNLMLGESTKDLDPEMQAANIYKLAGDLSSNDSAIFITDTLGFQYCQQDEGAEAFGHLDGTEAQGEENMETMKAPLRELPLAENLTNPERMEGYSFSLRYFTPGQLKQEKIASMYEASKAMLERILAGTPLATEESVSSGAVESTASGK